MDRGGPRLDVAHVVSALDQKVTGETPPSTPGVTNDPVRSGWSGGGGGGSGSGSSGAVTDDYNCVIDLGNGKVQAGWIAENPATVGGKMKIIVKLVIVCWKSFAIQWC